MKASSVEIAGRESAPVSRDDIVGTIATGTTVATDAARAIRAIRATGATGAMGAPGNDAAALVLRYQVAKGFFGRARGLLGRPLPMPGCGLLLRGVTLVHGIGMRDSLDLVFLDNEGIVVDCAILLPWRIAGCRAACHLLEMRGGEIERLGLRSGLRPRLVASATIFPAMMRVLVLAAAISVGSPQQASAQASLEVGAVATRPTVLAPLQLTQPIAARTMQRLENEAETRYRTPRSDSSHGDGERGGANRRASAGVSRDDGELIRLYESLTELASDRAAQSWLRIGNIHQRSGAVGAAIDAYRRLLEITPPVGPRAAEAAVAERKGLLNLAALSLDQARLAVSRLQSLGVSSSATALHARELTVLESGLMQQHAASQNSPPLPAGVELADQRSHPAALIQPPQVVERYTASARRNAVKAARGSLHVTPGDGLPASSVAKERARSTPTVLPNVEYLLGDPRRSKPAAERR